MFKVSTLVNKLTKSINNSQMSTKTNKHQTEMVKTTNWERVNKLLSKEERAHFWDHLMNMPHAQQQYRAMRNPYSMNVQEATIAVQQITLLFGWEDVSVDWLAETNSVVEFRTKYVSHGE